MLNDAEIAAASAARYRESNIRQGNRDYSAEHGIECAECGHIFPGMVDVCACCAAVTVPSQS